MFLFILFSKYSLVKINVERRQKTNISPLLRNVPPMKSAYLCSIKYWKAIILELSQKKRIIIFLNFIVSQMLKYLLIRMKSKKYRITIRRPHKMDLGLIKFTSAMAVLKMSRIEIRNIIDFPVIFLISLNM